MSGVIGFILGALFTTLAALLLRWYPDSDGCGCAACSTPVEAIADATREPPAPPAEPEPAPLTAIDLALLDEIDTAYWLLHPKAHTRGRHIADMLRAKAPGVADAELSRGVLHVCHVLAWIGDETGDPGFYRDVVTELGVTVRDLTAIERADHL